MVFFVLRGKEEFLTIMMWGFTDWRFCIGKTGPKCWTAPVKWW
jgi:hypothetical protein